MAWRHSSSLELCFSSANTWLIGQTVRAKSRKLFQDVSSDQDQRNYALCAKLPPLPLDVEQPQTPHQTWGIGTKLLPQPAIRSGAHLTA